MSNYGGGRAERDRLRHSPRNHNNPPSLKAPIISERQRRPQSNEQSFLNDKRLPEFLKRFALPFLKGKPNPEEQRAKEPRELPIASKKREIQQAIRDHDVILIVGPTGSGKTTLVPQFLEEMGLRSILLNPRRFATSEAAAFGAKLKGEELGHSVGYRHGLSAVASQDTTRMHTTEAFFHAQQIHHPAPQDVVIIRDEIHERTMHGALIDAHFRMRTARGEQINKRIFMSATPDIDNFRREFPNAPVIKVETRTFPVTELQQGLSVADDAMHYAKNEGPVIVFLPGKQRIKELTSELALTTPEDGIPPRVMPLHSDLPSELQQATLFSYPEGKIIASTNVAQTSLTIPDLKVVILSGKVRRLRINKEGIPTLTLEQISQAEARQMEGRVGRTSPGFVINYGAPISRLKPHAPHEITRVSLAGVALHLGSVGLHLADINRHLRHDERISDFQANLAYRELRHLRLWGSKSITEMGQKAAQLPCHQPRIAKFLVRARELSQNHHVDLLPLAVDVAAVCEARGIVYKDLQNLRHVAPVFGSDLLFQVNLFHKALATDPAQLAEGGVSASRVQKALSHRALLRRRIGIPADLEVPPLGAIEAKILTQALIESWADRAFQLKAVTDSGDYLYKPLAPEGDWVTVKRERTVSGGARIIIADRINVEHEDDYGRISTEHIAQFLTRVADEHIELLERVRPDEYAGHYERGISDALRPPGKQRKNEPRRDPRFMNPQHRNRGHRPQ